MDNITDPGLMPEINNNPSHSAEASTAVYATLFVLIFGISLFISWTNSPSNNSKFNSDITDKLTNDEFEMYNSNYLETETDVDDDIVLVRKTMITPFSIGNDVDPEDPDDPEGPEDTVPGIHQPDIQKGSGHSNQPTPLTIAKDNEMKQETNL